MNFNVLAGTALAGLALFPLSASAVTLTNGIGDGAVTVELDSFGRSELALFNPVGSIGQGSVFYESDVYISQGNGMPSIGAVAGNAEILSTSATEFVTRFDIGLLDVTLTQTLSESVASGAQTGSVLTQSYRITNLNTVDSRFNMLRYLDGDIELRDDSIDDGGGVLRQNGQVVLFETDVTGDNDLDNNTFVGITATGGTAPSGNGFAIRRYEGDGFQSYPQDLPLPDGVDVDGTGSFGEGDFVTNAYDVTLSLQRGFLIAANETQTFTTTTLFGNAAPPAPGSVEALPLLPDMVETNDGVPSFVFTIPASYQPGETIFIDPVIAAGYTYEVTGSTFASVTAPSFAAVADDSYTLSVNGVAVTLVSGETVLFSDLTNADVTLFTISGIDTDLMLDPENAEAFVTGVSLNDAGATVRQTPILFEIDTTDMAPVPLPASALLLLGAFGGLCSLRRRAPRRA